MKNKFVAFSILLASAFSVNSANATLYYIFCSGKGVSRGNIAAAFDGFALSWSGANQHARDCKKYGGGTPTIWQVGPTFFAKPGEPNFDGMVIDLSGLQLN